MLYRPGTGKIWDPSIVIFHGVYYCFTMYYEPGAAESYAMRLATSIDGVHWEDQGNVLTDSAPVWKMFIFRTRDGRFVLNHGSKSVPGAENDTLRYYVSDDLIHWNYVDSNMPDAQWYEVVNGRWDHMYCNPSEKGGYIGYAVGVPLPEYRSMIGIQRSEDGIRWRCCPPLQIDWQGIDPVREMEVGGCEKIGDRYYLVGGICPPFDGNYAYSCYVFIADQEDGPFRPDRQALRLCGFNGRCDEVFIQTLAAFCRNYDSDEILMSNTVCYQLDDVQNSNWLLPLRSVRVDAEGHLRLYYFQGNETLKGKMLDSFDSLKLRTKDYEGWLLHDEYLLHQLAEIDVQKGAVIEGTITIQPWPAAGSVRASCWRPTMAGFYIEESEETGTAILAECANTSNRAIHIGTFDTGNYRFAGEDRISQGCACPTGLDTFVPHTFRLLIRYGMFELYLDDMFVQTYLCSAMPTGKVMLILQNGRCDVRDVRVYEMNL